MPKTDLELLSIGMAQAQESAEASDSRFWASNPASKENFMALARGELSIRKAPEDKLENLPKLEFGEAEEAPPSIVSSDVFTTKEAYEKEKEDYDKREAEERMSIEDRIHAREAEKRKLIEDQWRPIIEERKEYREDITEAVEGQFATKRRLSTASLSYVQHNRAEAQKNVDLAIAKKNEALAALDIKTAEEIDKEVKAWQDEEKYWMNMKLDLDKQAFSQWMSKEQLDISRRGEERAEERHIFDTILDEYNVIKDIPVGESVEIGGYTFEGIKAEELEPFFTSERLFAAMKEIPTGTSQVVVDPTTGEEYLLTGISNDVITVTDDDGNVTGLDKAGNAKWRAEGAGKTKTRAPSTTIIMHESQSTALQDARVVLEASKGADGYYNTEQYQNERMRFVEITGKPDLFDEQFKSSLNPDDPSAMLFFDKADRDAFESGVIKYTDAERNALLELGITEEEINQFESLGVSAKELTGF